MLWQIYSGLRGSEQASYQMYASTVNLTAQIDVVSRRKDISRRIWAW